MTPLTVDLDFHRAGGFANAAHSLTLLSAPATHLLFTHPDHIHAGATHIILLTDLSWHCGGANG